jgi:hypothetical protein
MDLNKPDVLAELCKYVFNTDEGKRLMVELRKKFVDVPIWSPGIDQDRFVYFKEGQRHAIMFLQELSKS